MIDTEIIAFQTVTPLGANLYHLESCLRGRLASGIANHAVNTPVWFSVWNQNIFDDVGLDTFYLKVVPKFLGKSVSPGLVSPILVSKTLRASRPRPVTMIEATRTGSSVAYKLYPTTPGEPGAGNNSPAVASALSPFPIGQGTFSLQVDSGTPWEVSSTEDNCFAKDLICDKINYQHRTTGCKRRNV